MEKFDVVICGAGPAGCQLARELSEEKLNVLIIDKETEVGEPIRTTAGTPMETLETFDLPSSITTKKIHGIRTIGTNFKFEFLYDRPIFTTLKVKEFKQFLIKEAIKNGVDDFIGTTVTHPILKNNKVVGVQYSGLEGGGEVYGDVIVDATGVAGVLTSQLGLRRDKDFQRFMGSGTEFLMENLSLESDDVFEFYEGSKYIPCGYAWIFPTGKNEAKVGVCWLDEYAKKTTDKSIMYFMHKFITNNTQTKEGAVLEFHSGASSICGGLDSYTTNGFITIGDAACQISPAWGEGVRHALFSGRFAAETIIEAFRGNNFSKEKLKEYDKKWKEYAGLHWKFSILLREAMTKMNDKQLDYLLKISSQMDKEYLLKAILKLGSLTPKDYVLAVKQFSKIVGTSILKTLV